MSNGFFSEYTDDQKDDNLEQDGFVALPDEVVEEEDTFEWSEQELEEISRQNYVNQKNEEEFQEVMNNASKNLDSYWDRDNFVIKLVMICLFGFAIVGVAYYLFLWFFTN